jgi:hypothetical protein
VRTLTFGIDSRLSDLRPRSPLWGRPPPSFLQFSSLSLKRLRVKSEFENGSQSSRGLGFGFGRLVAT